MPNSTHQTICKIDTTNIIRLWINSINDNTTQKASLNDVGQFIFRYIYTASKRWTRALDTETSKGQGENSQPTTATRKSFKLGVIHQHSITPQYHHRNGTPYNLNDTKVYT